MAATTSASPSTSPSALQGTNQPSTSSVHRDELDGLDFDVFAPPAAAAATNELNRRPTVGQTRRASSPVDCDRPTLVQRTLFHSVTVTARDSRSIVPSGLNDYRPRIPLTELAIVRPDPFEHVDIPLGLPVVPLYEDDFVDALRASVAVPAGTQWSYPARLTLSNAQYKVYSVAVIDSWNEVIALTAPNHGVSTRLNWIPRLVVGFYPHQPVNPLSGDELARRVSSWALNNSGRFHLFFNYLLMADKDSLPSASTMYDAAIALRDLIDTSLGYVANSVLTPTFDQRVTMVVATRKSIWDALSALMATFQKFKALRAESYLIDHARRVQHAKFTPRMYAFIGAKLLIAFIHSGVLHSSFDFTIETYKEYGPLLVLVARFNMLVCGRPPRLSSITSMTAEALRAPLTPRDDATLDASPKPAYPNAALAAFDGQDRIAAALNDIVYINVATKNKRNENIVTEPLPLSRLVVEMLLRMNARVRQLNIDGILDSPLALPHWRNPSQRLSGDIDRAARAAGLVRNALEAAVIAYDGSLDAYPDVVEDFAALATSRFIRKHIDQVLVDSPRDTALDAILNLGMGHSRETSEVFYSRELRGLTTARLAVYQHVRETVLASRDGVFFRLLSSVARPTADSDADASLGLNFDAVATPSTPSTSSRSTRGRRQPDTPGSVARADWNREDKETLADLFAYMAEQNVPPSQHAVRNFLDHNSTLQLIVGLHEKGYDNAQIGNKYRNTRNAIVNKRTQPQTRAAAAALFPKTWLDAIATRTPRRHNH